jgi:predicted deacetylase
MIKTKLFFGFMILTFALTIIAGTLYSNDLEPVNVFNTATKLVQNLTESIPRSYVITQDTCTFNKPDEKTIILRMDDIGAWQYQKTLDILVKDILEKNMAVALGVIPRDLDEDKTTVRWLNKLKKNPNIEIALHGYTHEKNEFMNLSKEQASQRIDKGKNEIINTLGIIPITFIPPYNEYSAGTISALPENGFKVFSAKENEFNINGNLVSLGHTARTYEFDDSYFVPANEVIKDCKSSLENAKICVVMLHPQDYMINSDTDKLDPHKYEEFTKLLNGLDNLDAQFKNFKDTLSCSSGKIYF